MTDLSDRPEDRTLLGRERRDAIVTLVSEQGAARVGELAMRFGVSEMTIRRDIEALAAVNLLARVHGGATRLDRAAPSIDEPGFAAKSKRQLPEKRAIAERGASRIRPGGAIGITAGTTTYQLLPYLARIRDLTVVTNSIAIVSALSASASGVDLVLTGGSPTPSNAIVGPVAERCLAGFNLDQLFMGVHGMSEAGFTTPNLAEAQTNLAFIEAAREVCVLADSSKWGIVGLSTIGVLSAADVLVSDDALADDAVDACESASVTLDLVALT
ncbi:MAG: DeoR/GlpR family DNA-binding transcription regulator [Actinomycetota bacterium]